MSMPKWMRWLVDSIGQNIVGYVVVGGGLLGMYAVMNAIWHKLVWQELLAAGCLFAAGWIVALVVWLRQGKAIPSLLIHEAKYGIGDDRYRDVTVMLRGYLKRNTINVPVSNDTFNGDPYPGQKKHVIVRYSYGHASNKEMVRHENYQLVLPEDHDSLLFDEPIASAKTATTAKKPRLFCHATSYPRLKLDDAQIWRNSDHQYASLAYVFHVKNDPDDDSGTPALEVRAQVWWEYDTGVSGVDLSPACWVDELCGMVDILTCPPETSPLKM